MTNAAKRPRLTTDPPPVLLDEEHPPPLLPGLPDHIAHLCLSRVPPSTLSSVCRSWRRLIYSPSFPPFLSLYALSSSGDSSDSVDFLSFDPISAKWRTLPSPPPLRLQLRHPSFLSWSLPVQSVAVSGKLVLLAATTHESLPAISRPLVFDPITRKWLSGPPLAAPRRWCATGAVQNAVYVASGIGSVYSPEVARSVERWEVTENPFRGRNLGGRLTDWALKWERMGGFRDGKFSREAIEAVGWRGKLCMVNVKGKGAKEGVLYDVVRDSPEEMPEGMLFGWRGPAASMDEDTIYMVDQSKGALKKYDEGEDTWVEVMASEKLRGAEQVAAGGGRVCVVCGSGGIAVVDVRASPARLWVVDLPLGREALAVHILPRMSGHHHHHHHRPELEESFGFSSATTRTWD